MRILLVEDDRKLAQYLSKGLREEHYEIDVLHDGMSALSAVENMKYDLVILDIMLPQKNGFEVCKAFRRQGYALPVLMLTAKDGVEDIVKGLDSGADDYLAKPFVFDELLARIRALFRRNQQRRQAVLSIADLRLDPYTHRVHRNGKEIALTGKEYALLEYLMRNEGRIVTNTNIIEHVWDSQIDPTTNVVSVYVHYLRNKIDKDFDLKLIKTVRSIGYIIESP